MSQHPDHVMRARMPQPGYADHHDLLPAEGQVTAGSVSSSRPRFRIEVPAEDGTVLLEMSETSDGRLDIRYDPDRVTEGAMRFLDGMRQWAGAVGIRWQSEVERAVSE